MAHHLMSGLSIHGHFLRSAKFWLQNRADSAHRGANLKWLNHLASATVDKPEKKRWVKSWLSAFRSTPGSGDLSVKGPTMDQA